MEGSALQRKDELNVALYTAWHTAVFALARYSGKLKPLSDYLSTDEQPKGEALQHAKAIAFFHRLKARGIPVEITRH